ncbi:LPXTG cell wall anchor domain-containing protein [Nocardioides sp. MH1]|uniref:LPXTG cell wall anchor domain-containing protein n=1 Tax=Nocardioides sp. MH1 TaxID=3242490 RepID=UPI00351FF8A6
MADADRHTAGAFDIRNVIGGLLGLYGVVLLVTGLVSDEAPDRTGDINANIWTGLGLLVAAAAFLVWSRLRPTVVDEKAVAEERESREAPPSGH